MKRNLPHLFHNLRLKRKIALLCMVLIMCTTLPMGFLLYRYFANMTKETSVVHSSEVMVNVGNYLDQKLKGIINRLYALRGDDTFNTITTGYLFNNEPQYHAEALSYFSNIFAELRFSEPFISSVFLYTPKGEFYDLSLSINRRGFKETELFSRISAQHDSFLYWLPSSEGELYKESGQIIPLVFKFTIRGYNEELFLVVHLSESKILEYLQQIDREPGNSTIIVDQLGQPIALDNTAVSLAFLAKGQDWPALAADGSSNAQSAIGKDHYYINYQSTNVAPWILVHIQSESSLLAKLRSIRIFIAGVLMGSIVLGFAVAYYISSSISRPLSNLERSMKMIRLRKLDVRFHYPYEDEVGRLGQSFNFMAEEMEDMIYRLNQYISSLQQEKERVRTEQTLKRKAELKALQSQITPHFLYNTLDSIKWMAEKNGQQEISRMTTALASFFRIALSRGKEHISIREEIEHTSSYLTIQQMRYGELFTFSIEAEEQIGEDMTVKLLLQPLVENAIYHGIKPLPDGGRIKITAAARGTDIVLTVEDNGAGIHPIKLQMIRKRLSHPQAGGEDGYGLYNVHDRIRLYFGESYGLSIESAPGEGTVVTAVIPRWSRKDVEHV